MLAWSTETNTTMKSWKELWLRYKVTLKKRTHEMLAWSAEMNTIMKGILTKILGYLGQKIN